ncbi:MAG: ISAzo13 family transposase, partial [Synergistaceae bacterium]|nr:ISAzo13 family transposase [Synergistaceae bacterium]
MDEAAKLKQKYGMLRPYLNEASMRICVAADAIMLGRGGPSLAARASGLSRTTIYAGMHEINENASKTVEVPKRER